MKQITVALAAVVAVVFLTAAVAAAHCEIPCGIYDDHLRAQLMAEHVTTMEKSMKQITDLSKENPVIYNQLVRWINNKELHANEFQEIVTQYFMTQRIKPDMEKYNEKLGVLHQMLVYAMKCKQTTDLGNIEKLRDLLKAFEKLYFGHDH